MLKVIDQWFHRLTPFLFILTIILFSYFRLRPIYFQTVPYTFDQGRDFLKAAQIIREGDIPFIGPSVGAIQGLFHGVWWYYFLAIPYLFFQGNPIGFYYTMFILQLFGVLLFTFFLKKELNERIAFLFFLIVSISPYFSQNAYFPGNNMLTPMFVLLFIFSIVRLIKSQKPFYAFLTTLSLGFMFETELSFGIFVIPAFCAVFLLLKETRNLLTKKNLFLAVIGIVIPSLPRLMFEAKNHFLQVKAAFDFIKHPTSSNAISLTGAFYDRLSFFSIYLKEIFFDRSPILTLAFVIPICAGFILFYKKVKPQNRTITLFFIGLIITTFFLSILSHNNFFWGNYLEGFQYILLFTLLYGLYSLSRKTEFTYFIYGFIGIFLCLNTYLLLLVLRDTSPIPALGLRADQITVRSYYSYAKDNTCLQIYTPPVIPFTYNYLFQYQSLHGKFYPDEGNTTTDKCWYIIDDDSDKNRVENWRHDHIPQNAKLIESHIMPNKTSIELWQRHP